MDANIIAALSKAGVAAWAIAGLVLVWLLLKYGPSAYKTISDCWLDHRRFDNERAATQEAIAIAWANRQEPELALKVSTATLAVEHKAKGKEG